MVTLTTVDPWVGIRGGLSEAARRFARLLREVGDPRRTAVGEWTIADTAQHVGMAVRLDTASALMEIPDDLSEVVSAAVNATVDGVATMNAWALEIAPDVPLDELANTIEGGVDELLARTDAMKGDEQVIWLAGTTLPVAGVLAHLTFEFLVHGFDIAKAASKRWPIPEQVTVLLWDAFFVNFFGGPNAGTFMRAAEQTAGPFRCEFRVQGTEPLTFVYEDGRLEASRDGPHADVRIAADPSTMLLLMFQRVSPVSMTLRGKVRVWGRRPWRLRRVLRVLRTP